MVDGTPFGRIEDAKPNWRGCLEHILTEQVEAWRNGARATVGALLEEVRNGALTPQEASAQLALTGLGYLAAGERVPRDVGPLLAIPNRSTFVGRLLAGSEWAGAPGRGGPWKDALRQAPAGVVLADPALNRVRINGVQERCTLIALDRYRDG